MSSKIDPIIESRGCPNECSIYHERKMGKHGPFYYCNRCKHSMSEAPRGGIDTPCGTCAVCGGLLFWRALPDGTLFKACWSHDKHARIFRKAL